MTTTSTGGPLIQMERVNKHFGSLHVLRDVTVSIDRGGSFKQAVTLKFEAPAGVKVNPAEATIPGSDTRVKVGIEAAPDAAPGRHTINVIGTPETGKATSVKMDIDVKKS